MFDSTGEVVTYSFLSKRNGVRGQVPPLGSLELEVMNQVWSEGPVSAQALQLALERHRDVTLSTVQSTVERLCRNGLLAREKQGRAYVYISAMSRGTLIARMLADLIGGLGGGQRAPASDFVDFTEPLDEATLSLLEDWLAACRPAGSTQGEDEK